MRDPRQSFERAGPLAQTPASIASKLVTADIGGTHARFAIAEIGDGGRLAIGEPYVLKTAEYEGLADAWSAFRALHGGKLPGAAAFGLAGPVTGGPVRFINSGWVVDPATIDRELGLDRHLVLNDFGAMAHAVHVLGDDHVVHLCGPDRPLPDPGVISVIGPGTGLGVSILLRRASGPVVLETEGAHIHFAPLAPDEHRVSGTISALYGRTSVERIVSGPGLGEIARALSPGDARSDAELWNAALDPARAGLQRELSLFLASFGAAVGDLSLAHGSLGVALTGGLANRLRQAIAASDFYPRFLDKGRYRERMETIPIKLVTHPQPGLLGAAAAFARGFPG